MDGEAAVTREPDGPTEGWLILERLKDLTEQSAGLRRWVEQEIKDLRQEIKDVRAVWVTILGALIGLYARGG